MRLLSSRTQWQRLFVILAIAAAILMPLSLALYGWPSLPQHRSLDASKYSERISLLKYFVSLGFSVIGASWYLVSGTAGGQRMSGRSVAILSWGWTCLGISVLSAIVEVYLTYKDFYYWPLVVAEGYASGFHRFKHIFSLHMLHLTYKITDYLFFVGAVLVILALVGVLHSRQESGKEGQGTA